MKKIAIFLILILLLVSTAYASKTFAAEEVHIFEYMPDNLLIIAGFTDINAEVMGDIYAISGRSEIGGQIDGDVVILGGEHTISNVINGDIRVIGGSVMINALIKGDVIIAGGSVLLSEDSVIERDLFVVGGDVKILGNVNEDLKVSAGTLILGGNIGGNAEIKAGEISFVGTPSIGGDFSYQSPKEEDLSQIHVGNVVHYTRYKEVEMPRYLPGLIAFLMVLLAGIASISLFTRFSKRVAVTIITSFWKSVGAAVIAFLLLPIICFILFVSLIGIPLGLLILGAFIAMIFLSRVYFSVVLGRAFMRLFRLEKNIMLDFFVGMVLLTVLFMIPIIGPLMRIVTVLAGTGGILLVIKGKKKKVPKVKPYR